MGALSHLRIVEIGSAAATGYCARLFADFGAAVQKVEPPGGDPLRRTALLTPKGQSAWFAFLNFNKSSLALDPADASASSRLASASILCRRSGQSEACPPFGIRMRIEWWARPKRAFVCPPSYEAFCKPSPSGKSAKSCQSHAKKIFLFPKTPNQL
jgi:hypothetical protein